MKGRGELLQKVTVVIPVCVPDYVLPPAYYDVRVLLLSNGRGPLYNDKAQVLRVPWRGHARTRKLALAHIDTPYIFFTVQDAIPHKDMLFLLLNELEGKVNWDIVLPRQVAPKDACSDVQQSVARWMPNAEAPYAFQQADHVGALYRTEDLRQWALAEVPIAEDVWWSIGRRVGCIPQAELYHGHERKGWALFRREYAIHTQLHVLKLIGRPSLKGMVSWHRIRRGAFKKWGVDTMEQLGRWLAWLKA